MFAVLFHSKKEKLDNECAGMLKFMRIRNVVGVGILFCGKMILEDGIVSRRRRGSCCVCEVGQVTIGNVSNFASGLPTAAS